MPISLTFGSVWNEQIVAGPGTEENINGGLVTMYSAAQSATDSLNGNGYLPAGGSEQGTVCFSGNEGQSVDSFLSPQFLVVYAPLSAGRALWAGSL